MDKPEALRLAQELEEAAAELRRLHSDAQRYYWVLRHYGEFHGKWTLAAFQRRASRSNT
jgi:hypothetical protein